MAVGSKGLAPSDLDAMTNERLVAEAKKAKEELFNLRFQAATGQLETQGRIRAVKRDIARIYTLLRERELGMRLAPESADAVGGKTPMTRSLRDRLPGARRAKAAEAK